jgi:ubiquinone biosynthesis protein
MLEQIGPQKLLEQLKAEAPRYAKLIPELPRLMHEFLKNKSEPALNEEVLKLLKETRQTQSTLMRILWVAMGFVFGMLAMQWLFQVA